ncbi:hypothetical protein D1007_36209 [Hordeum vulgare]|uniref:Predicted protein n=1 Tax=Hordeum vulgare subsp. vulgare TaxID=112509 RepID=F2DGQ1_HORVV|nr:uncharacterized protein At5g39865-like [Hordeum vulgare subsp. vulgare]KAE8789564.1 hypothetical protein D1007_36209 [Hordeum vulgare]KAI5012462.1 hypothetical protein ZWY2020_024728 [Hordeum vulgare]BAJ94272.1 predicted protein [Hordeum vulgare subsp. vulgare]
MTIQTLKARILRVLRSSLPAAPAAASAPLPPSPTKSGRVVLHSIDALSDDGSFFDAHETPTKSNLPAEPIDDDWELVDQDGYDRDSLATAPAPASDPDGILLDFPARCPPGGNEAVVLYTTTLRGIRKTFEDCNDVRALLENLAVAFQERDVSMDRGLREQLWAATGDKAVPPRLFVRGHDLGGAAQVLALHEDGRLTSLLQLPSHSPPEAAVSSNKKKGKCEACGGLSFVVCGECGGSRKLFDGERGGVRCHGCNENGLVMCKICMYPS